MLNIWTAVVYFLPIVNGMNQWSTRISVSFHQFHQQMKHERQPPVTAASCTWLQSCVTECSSFWTSFPSFSPDVTHVFPEFPAPDLGNVFLQEGVTMNDVKTLQLLYRRHCEVITLNIFNWFIKWYGTLFMCSSHILLSEKARTSQGMCDLLGIATQILHLMLFLHSVTCFVLR